MRNTLTTAVMATAIAAVLIGGGVALGASTHHPVAACSKKSNHALGLLKNGRCSKGFSKVTLGAQGPRGIPGTRGARGPAGPGAIFDTLTVGNNDEGVDFPETIGGMAITTTCELGPGVELSVGPSSGTVDASGTDSADATITPVDVLSAASVGESGTHQADIDIIASANGGPFVHLDVHGTWANNTCHYWMVSIPASQAPPLTD